MSRYTPQSAVDYNDNPPPDDGSQVALNEITWAGIRQKLTDVLKLFTENVDTAIQALDAKLPHSGVSLVNTNYTIQDTDNGKIVRTTVGGNTFTLPDAAVVGSQFYITLKNQASVAQTIDTAAGTIDGKASITLTSAAVNLGNDGTDWFLSSETTDDGSGAVEPLVPFSAGDYMMKARNTDDGAWLLCDARAVSRTTYAALFAVIGTTFGVGDGSTTFNLPDARGKALLPENNASLPGGVDGQLTQRNMGQTGGSELLQSHTHTGPSHTHDGSSMKAAETSGVGSVRGVNAANVLVGTPGTGVEITGTTGASGTGNTGQTGAGNAENMMPFSVIGNLFIYSA